MKNLIAVIMISAAWTAAGEAAAAEGAACSRACLLEAMTRFVAAARGGDLKQIPLTGEAEVRENARLVRVEETAWRRVKAVRSEMTFADPVTGNVVLRAGVELEDGKPGYLSTRLHVGPGGKITDVEISADDSPRVVAEYVWKLDPLFSETLPVEDRVSREELLALGQRYFHSLSTHVAVREDFAPECDRYHSGQRITNVERNTVEGGGPRTCASSLEGNPPWGPATEQRFPVADPERGIVIGITLLHYPKAAGKPKMYVSEVFKAVRGRIVKIDNIGLMMRDVDTLGFVH